MKIFVMAVFVLALGAGVVAGLVAARLPNASGSTLAAPARSGQSPLAEALQLTAEQSRQMKKIWEGIRDLSADDLEASRKLLNDRDDAISALVPDEKRPALNEIRRAYQEKTAALVGRRQAAFEKAVSQTKSILTESQRKKYEKILTKRLGNDARGDHDLGAEPTRAPAGEAPPE